MPQSPCEELEEPTKLEDSQVDVFCLQTAPSFADYKGLRSQDIFFFIIIIIIDINHCYSLVLLISKQDAQKNNWQCNLKMKQGWPVLDCV